MRKITLEQAEKLALRNPNFYWDGWTLVHTKQSPMAMFRADGILRNNRWFIAKRYDVGSDGLYRVPSKVIGHGI